MDSSSEKYCFGNSGDRDKVLAKLSMILVPSDKVSSDEDCLVVQMQEHRRELIQRYVLMTYPETKINFSSGEMRQEPCKLKIEKERSRVKNRSVISANPQDINFSQSTSTLAQNEVFLIETIKEFELLIDQESIKGVCQYIKPDRYEITLKLKKVPRTLVNVVSGSTMIVTTPPEDQETFELVTTLQLQRGERVNVGEVVQKTRKKDRDLNLDPSLKNEHENNKLQETAYLSIQ